MENKFASLLIKLKTLIDNIVDDFSNSYKVLFLISELNVCSPKELCSILNMAKSNLAIIASKLRLQEYIEQYKTDFNNKEILYKITEQGKTKLDAKLAKIEKNKNKMEIIKKLQCLLNK